MTANRPNVFLMSVLPGTPLKAAVYAGIAGNQTRVIVAIHRNVNFEKVLVAQFFYRVPINAAES